MESLRGVRAIGSQKAPASKGREASRGVGKLSRKKEAPLLNIPLGVHFVKEKKVLLICDSNNHRVMVLDPFKNDVYPWLGAGEEGFADGRTG